MFISFFFEYLQIDIIKAGAPEKHRKLKSCVGFIPNASHRSQTSS